MSCGSPRPPATTVRSSPERDHLPTRSVLTRCAGQVTLRSRWLPGCLRPDHPGDHTRQRLRLRLDCLFALPSSRFARVCGGLSLVECSDVCPETWPRAAHRQQTASTQVRTPRASRPGFPCPGRGGPRYRAAPALARRERSSRKDASWLRPAPPRPPRPPRTTWRSPERQPGSPSRRSASRCGCPICSTCRPSPSSGWSATRRGSSVASTPATRTRSAVSRRSSPRSPRSKTSPDRCRCPSPTRASTRSRPPRRSARTRT